MNNKIEKMIKGLDKNSAGIITSNVNRRYFLDFDSSAGTLFATNEKAYFIIDFRYIEAAKDKIKNDNIEIILQDDLFFQLSEIVKKHDIKTVFLENDYNTLSEYESIKEMVKPAEVSLDRKLNDAIIELRKYKDKEEIKRIKEAQKLTDETFSYALEIIKPGKTEKEVALEMEFFMRKKGADAVGFDFIVLTGANTSMPHGVPSDTIIEKGSFVLMDFGAEVNGYRSDMTRTVAVGEVSEKHKKVYNTVLESQLKALDAIKIGANVEDIDTIARNYIYSEGYEGMFGHGLGHSVGIEVHELPRFSKGAKGVLEEGIVMTVEPGIYIPKEFGVRIEDMVIMTANGYENITKSKKELIIL